MRTIPTGRGGATGPTGPQGPQGVSGLTAGLGTVLANNPLTNDLPIQGGYDGAGNGGANVAVLGPVGTVAGDVVIAAGDKTTLATDGRLKVHASASDGIAGQALVSNGAGFTVWGSLIIAAGVPAGAPNGKLPFAIDTTAITGGLYYWNSAAWVKIVTI